MLEGNTLISQFEKAALDYDSLRKSGTAKQMNKQFDLMYKIAGELSKIGKLIELRNILSSDKESVRYFAASMILASFPDEAEAVLTEIAKSKGFYSFNAKVTLQEWHKGNIKFDY